MYAEADNHQVKEHNAAIYTSYMQQQAPPKLEDFFSGGGDSTETQDSSLTHIYDHHQPDGASAYFSNGEQQDLKSILGFQAFSANSGSAVDDSAFAGQTQSPVESASDLVAYSHCPITATNNGLSLDVNINNNNNDNSKAIVSADSESCKKIADTFGQRTSIYRGVTR